MRFDEPEIKRHGELGGFSQSNVLCLGFLFLGWGSFSMGSGDAVKYLLFGLTIALVSFLLLT